MVQIICVYCSLVHMQKRRRLDVAKLHLAIEMKKRDAINDDDE